MDFEGLEIIETILLAVHDNTADYTREEAMEYILKNFDKEDFGFGIDTKLVPGVGRVFKVRLLEVAQ